MRALCEAGLCVEARLRWLRAVCEAGVCGGARLSWGLCVKQGCAWGLA